MKKSAYLIISTLVYLLAGTSVFAQNSGNRYMLLPEGGGYYQVPNKEVQNPAYAASYTLTTTHEETTINMGQLTGGLTLNANVANCYVDDKLTVIFKANSSGQTVTFGSGFLTNGSLPVLASTSAIITFQFNGTAWFEISRQNMSPVTKTKTASTFTTAATYTITPAQLAGGILVVSASTGTVTLTLPTATAAATQLGATTGSTYDFVVTNVSGGSTAVVAVNTNITASTFPATNTLSLTESATTGIAVFRLTFISPTTATLTRVN